MKAIWNGVIVAESDVTEVVDGYHYFPKTALMQHCFRSGIVETTCPSKGTARYYDIVVDGDWQPNGAWYYPEPKERFRCIQDHVAFRRGIEVVL